MNVRWFFFSLLLGVIACGAAPSDGLAQCGDCQTDIDANLHVNPQTAFLGWFEPFHSLPSSGFCIFTHQSGCSAGLSAELNNELWSGLADAEGERLEVLLATWGPRVEYNETRRASQVLDCVGKAYIAHFPLKERQAEVVFRYFATAVD